MTVVLTVAVFAIILLAAWGGMRLMQRATGCALPSDTGERTSTRDSFPS